MLIENTLFGVVDKVQEAINDLRAYEPPEGYYVAFSGGKDSVVMLDLVKRAEVKFEAFHNIVTIEPPELMKFIYKEYPEVKMIHTEKTMYRLIVENGVPPLRQMRYCHRILKQGGEDRIKITGVRAEESKRRAMKKKYEPIWNHKGYYLNLILYWTEADVWEYIRKFNVKYCSLYDEGRKRIGCLFCPFANQEQIDDDLKRYPQVARYLITACQAAIEARASRGKPLGKYKTGEEMFNAWINKDKRKPKKDRNLDNLFE